MVMQIVTYREREFEGHKIFIRRIGNYFEYLVFIGGRPYSASQIVRPTILGRMLKLLLIKKDVFSEEQIAYVLKYLETLAMGTVRELIKPGLDGTK